VSEYVPSYLIFFVHLTKISCTTSEQNEGVDSFKKRTSEHVHLKEHYLPNSTIYNPKLTLRSGIMLM